MASYHVEELFPTPVIQFIIEENTDELKDIKNFTASFHTCDVVKDINPEDNNLNVTLDGGGKRVLERFPRIRDLFLDKFNLIAEDYLGYIKKNYIITTSWVTYTKKGGRSQQHRHRNSFWSGVYYFQDEYPEGSAKIQFTNPAEGIPDVNYSNLDIDHFNKVNSNAWIFSPVPKQLLLFPSHLEHEIMLHEIDTVRHSLAFNIMPLNRWGDADSSYDMAWSVPEYIKDVVK